MLIPRILDNFLSKVVTVGLKNTCCSAMVLMEICDICVGDISLFVTSAKMLLYSRRQWSFGKEASWGSFFSGEACH